MLELVCSTLLEKGSEADSCRISGEPILPAILSPRLRPREVEEPAALPALILSTVELSGAQWRGEKCQELSANN